METEIAVFKHKESVVLSQQQMAGGEKLSFIMGDQDRRKQSVTSAPGEKSDFK